MKILTDKYGRVHDYLRISLTDRCNLNCIYCNPVYAKAKFIEKEDILSYENILRIIKIFAGELGFKKFRFTGGEPLVRKGVVEFFCLLSNLKRQYKFKTAITTNGTLLFEMLPELKKYGVDNINISLDSLKHESFKAITGKNNFNDVIDAIYKAKQIGFEGLKINCVVMKGVNDSEILDFVRFAIMEDINIRFIEYMPFSNNGWNNNEFISYKEIRNIILENYELIDSDSNGSVSKDYLIKHHEGKVSFISSISDHFCNTCSRLRLTAKGNLRLCLFSTRANELDLKSMLSNKLITDSGISSIITDYLMLKPKEHPGIEELVKLDLNYMLTNGG
ncbi:MAG TPA: GTP 3',8-cyclase MoaA [Ignavibacteria bacterium]